MCPGLFGVAVVVLHLSHRAQETAHRIVQEEHGSAALPHHQTPFAANSHDVVTHTLDRATYKTIVQKSSMKKRSMYGEFLKNVGFLASCSPAEVLQLADALKPCSYKPGDTLIRYGDEGLWFFIIAEGCVSVHGRGQDLSVTDVCEFTVGDCVGELEFINKHKCVADVVAKTPVRAAKMHRHHFEMCLGPIVEVLKRQADTAEKFTYYRQVCPGAQCSVYFHQRGLHDAN